MNTLIKTNYTLGTRLTRRSYISIVISIIAGLNAILFGLVNMTEMFPVLYTTVIALYHVLILSVLQIKHDVYLNRHQLRIYPLSNREVLFFLWINEIADFRTLVFLIPVSVCVFSLSPSQTVLGLIYMACACITYTVFCLFLLIFKLLLNEFNRFLKPIQLVSLILTMIVISEGGFIAEWHIGNLEIAFLIAFSSTLTILFLVLYVLACYLILRESNP